MNQSPAQNSKLILAAMIFAVSAQVQEDVDAIPQDFALASPTVFYAMAAVMAVAFLISLARMPAGKVEEEV